MSEEPTPIVFTVVLIALPTITLIGALFTDDPSLQHILTRLEQDHQVTCHDFEPEIFAWRELPRLVEQGWVEEVPDEEREDKAHRYDPDDLDQFEQQGVLYQLTPRGFRRLKVLRAVAALKQHLRGA